MTPLFETISQTLISFLRDEFEVQIASEQIVINDTRDDVDGDFTVVVFPLAGRMKKSPPDAAAILGQHLVDQIDDIVSFDVIKGFLNLTCSAAFWVNQVGFQRDEGIHIPQSASGKIVLEYASPNSNKPLHLGHVRNVLLGWSVGQILSAVGHDVHYTQIVNDRGIAICKSMIAWKLFMDEATPESTGIKSDHFVGDAYVKFGQVIEEEYQRWQSTGEALATYEKFQKDNEQIESFFKRYKNDYFNNNSELGRSTREMLQQWEQGDEEVRDLWKKLNDWFMSGFIETCNRLGIRFDSINYESITYLLGKDIVQEGLEKGVFYKEEDGSVWIDLTEAGYDKKLVLRSDGTSVYITQDLGTARVRYEELNMDGMIYTVGNEQNYHFDVLFEILKRLGEPYADHLHHLSYGMVDLPTGRMKTREGTVVDADDLIEEVVAAVRSNSVERGELDMLTEDERNEIYETIGMGALKYYMLRVDAKKRMVFNPEESVDLQGQTGPYIQNAYVRIMSIIRKLGEEVQSDLKPIDIVHAEEKHVIRHMMHLGEEVSNAAQKYDPAIVASFAYKLAKLFHRFYHEHSIARAETSETQTFRLEMAKLVADQLNYTMKLLGITMPNRM